MGFNAKTMKREYKGWKREFLHCSPVLKPHFTLAVVGACSISKLIGLDKKIKVLLICCWMCISTLLSVCLFSIRKGQLRWLLKRNFFCPLFGLFWQVKVKMETISCLNSNFLNTISITRLCGRWRLASDEWQIFSFETVHVISLDTVWVHCVESNSITLHYV